MQCGSVHSSPSHVQWLHGQSLILALNPRSTSDISLTATRSLRSQTLKYQAATEFPEHFFTISSGRIPTDAHFEYRCTQIHTGDEPCLC